MAEGNKMDSERTAAAEFALAVLAAAIVGGLSWMVRKLLRVR